MVEQASRRDVILQVLDDPAWRDLLIAWVAMAKTTPSVIYPSMPYLLGCAKTELHVTGEIEHTVTIQTIRQALGIVDIKALPAPRKQAG
mgnify:CR=1 FL=1